jgi:hypothetical protein
VGRNAGAQAETARVTNSLVWEGGRPRLALLIHLTSHQETQTISAPHQDDRFRVRFLFSRTVLFVGVPERANHWTSWLRVPGMGMVTFGCTAASSGTPGRKRLSGGDLHHQRFVRVAIIERDVLGVDGRVFLEQRQRQTRDFAYLIRYIT